MPNLLDSLDVFYGELTPARATVYARLEGLESTEGLSLSGFVRGPRCFHATTLQSSARLEDAGPGPSLLAKSLVIDPCYWSPETPNIYDVTVELRKGNDIIASEVRQIGFKPLGISGRFFTWEGKPWVMRGATNRTVNADKLRIWSDRSTSILFANPPTAKQLDHSALRGILAWVLMPMFGRPATLKRAMRDLSGCPSVAGFLMLTKTSSDQIPQSLLEATPNLLIGIALGSATKTPPSQRHRIFHHVRLEKDWGIDEGLTSLDSPLLAVREQGPNRADNEHPFLSIERARAACDKLQADLAPYGQFAGYIV